MWKVWAAVAAVVIVIVLGYNALFNQRSDWEQSWYDRGYDVASQLIDDGANSEDEVIQGCDVMAPTGNSEAIKQYNTGCDARWTEE